MFKPMNTSDSATSLRKVLLYAHHGWGKTTQAKYYNDKLGKGFIISGESGLSSVKSAGIDYLPFTSFDGKHDPANDIYSFTGICKMIASDEFKQAGYKWLMLDSLTELSDMILAYVEEQHSGDKNGFKVWGDYANQIIGACKWVRDLPYHVIVTALAKEENNDNGEVEYWPMIKGSSAQKQLPGIFDCVLCGIRHTFKDTADGHSKIQRFIVTEEVRGWHGKVRDEKRRLKPVERTSNIIDLFDRMDMDDSEFEKFVQSQQSTKPQGEI